MHELGILFSIRDTVEDIAKENNLTEIASITLQVGEISSVVPEYLQKCYPAAIEKSVLLQNTELKIEIMPANCICRACNKVYHFLEYENQCPKCGAVDNMDFISGREFMIKEIEGC